MSSKDERKKRPSGGQPFAKRLFSLDLNKSSKRAESQATLAAAEKSSLDESQPGSSDVPHNSRPRVPGLSKRLDFSFMEKPRASIDEGQDPFSDSPSSATSRGGIGGWGGGRMMDSPDSASAEDRSFSPQSSTTNLPGRVTVEKSSTASSGWRRPRKKPSMLSARSEAYSESNEEPSSPSKLRWDHVRQHVLPTNAALRPPPPIASSSIFTPPSRPGTPTKQFRIGKLGFKQVVEHIQEVSGDQSERFAKDVWDACWMARFGEQRAQKPEREVTPGAFNLTFMSNASVPGIHGLGNSSTASLSTTMLNKRGLRRPPSMQSLASSSHSTPTVLTLSSVLSRYSSLSATSQDYVDTLPHEAHVLSTLLIQFLNPVNGSQIDAERIIAIEAFEVSVKSWRADSNAVSHLLYISSKLKSSMNIVGRTSTLPVVLQSYVRWVAAKTYQDATPWGLFFVSIYTTRTFQDRLSSHASDCAPSNVFPACFPVSSVRHPRRNSICSRTYSRDSGRLC